MAYSAADLKMVDDHIALGVQHVERQREILAWLKSRGHPTDIAEDLLIEFEATLAQHRAHRTQMRRENAAESLPAGAVEPVRRRRRSSPKKS